MVEWILFTVIDCTHVPDAISCCYSVEETETSIVLEMAVFLSLSRLPSCITFS